MKRAILYGRVSTDDQADKGYSLPSQLDATREYAKRLGYRVVAELAEDYSGATRIAERPEGKKLVQMLEADRADAVIVHQVDRASRKLGDLVNTVEDWLNAEVEVYSCDVGKIESENDITLVIKGWQGTDERKKILERTTRGKRKKAESGKVVCSRPPYGYTLVRDGNGKIVSLVEVKDRAQIVRLIYRWYVYGDETGKLLSADAIADRLTAMRVPTPGEALNYDRKLAPGVWNRIAVQYFLANEVYAGVYRFGNPPIPVSVPPIIDRATWNRAQKRKEQNTLLAKRNAKYDYLLRSLVTCKCGKRMHGMNRRGMRFYYVCDGVRQMASRKRCNEKSVRGEVLEWLIWEGVRQRVRDTDKVKHDLKAAQKEEIALSEPRRAELEALEAKIARTEKKAARLGRALSAVDPDGASARELKKDIEANDASYKEQIRRRDELTQEINSRRLTDDAISNILTFNQIVKEGIEGATLDDKQRYLQALRVQIKIRDGRFYLTSLLGAWDGEIPSVHAFRTLPSTVDVDSP